MRGQTAVWSHGHCSGMGSNSALELLLAMAPEQAAQARSCKSGIIHQYEPTSQVEEEGSHALLEFISSMEPSMSETGCESMSPPTHWRS